MHVCMITHTHTLYYMCVCVCVRVCVLIILCVCVCVCVCVYVLYVCMYRYIHMNRAAQKAACQRAVLKVRPDQLINQNIDNIIKINNMNGMN